MQYRGANIRLLKQPDVSDMQATLAAIRAQGCNALAVNTIHKVYLNGTDLATPPLGWEPWQLIYPDLGQDPAHPFGDTVSEELVYATAEVALQMGFERVILKPMIDSDYAQWRGNITVPPELRLAFSAAYKEKFLARYLFIIKGFGLDLCIGTEMVKVSEQLGAPFWIDIVDWLRAQGVTQRLTYAANWGWEADAEYNRLHDLWPHLDYIGIDAYWPMANKGYTGPITVDLLLNGAAQNIGWSRRLADDNGVPFAWCPPIDHDLQRLAAGVGKPLWFTEIGYGATKQAALDPMGDTPPGERTTEVQTVLWQAAREKWQDVLEGWCAWEAGVATTKGGTHDIIGAPAAQYALGA